MVRKIISIVLLTTILGFSTPIFLDTVKVYVARGFQTVDLAESDCNDPEFYDIGCPEPTKDIIDQLSAAGYPYYVGHDEASIQFLSSAPGSGSNMQWEIQLPSMDPSPTQDGSSIASFELYGAFWIGIALCDPNSYPFGYCTPDSDLNNPSIAGSALMELQFYPPGSPFRPSAFCPNSQWCARLEIFVLETNSACLGVRTQTAFITTDGTVRGPRLLMSDGDNVLITIRDTPSGLETAIEDLATLSTGIMAASGANGFYHIDPSNCFTSPFDFHPMYDTASPGNVVSWAGLLPNVNAVFEIGHWELCGDSSCSIRPDGDEDDVGCQMVLGVGGCITIDPTSVGDLDFDGVSYQEVWPDGKASHPSSLVIKAPGSESGAGPRSFDGTSYSESYSTVHFARTVNPIGAPFYPFYSQSHGLLCHLSFGNDVPGVTDDDFGKTLQYGTTMDNPCRARMLRVQVDIKPSSISLRSRGTISVAILSSSDFDAPRDVDRSSLTFGRTGKETSLITCTTGDPDVNQDKLPDLICRFDATVSGFMRGDVKGILRGKLVSGATFEGRDFVKVR